MSVFDDLGQGISNDINYIKEDVLGIKSAAKKNTGDASLPWVTGGTKSTSRFFAPIPIDKERWDQLYPYRLIVIDTKTGQPVGGKIAPDVDVAIGQSIVTFKPLGSIWEFRLPISPQQLSISDQYAINTTATLRGVVEEHNGIKFKGINMSGTFGVWPYREAITKPPTSPGLIRSLLGGTLEGIGEVVSSVTSVINTITSGSPANKPITIRPELSSAGPTSTGYYMAMAMQQFLEQYAEAKKDPKNASWRLVFDIQKQNTAYVVTPMQFQWQQSANKPMEITYALNLKAWRRIKLDSLKPVKADVQTISPGILQRILNTLTQARQVAAAAYDLIGAVRSDVDKPLEVLRQTTLFVKDLAGVAATAADLPSQIAQDYSSAIKSSILGNSDNIRDASTDSGTRQALSDMQAESALNEGLSASAVASGQLGSTSASYSSINPSNNVFDQPARYFDLLDNVPVYSLSLTSAQQAVIDELLAESRQITVDDLKQFRAIIQDLALQISNYFGAGDAFYSQIYGRPAPTVRLDAMTLDEYTILASFYEVMQSFDILTATSYIDDLQKQSNMDYVAGLADDANIPFEVPNSKILTPVPFGLTIEGIAMRYLGDAQRWIEIATLNNLREPYIDENGFQLSLLSNATGRQITVSQVDNLYEGQRVILRSATQVPTARRILGIDRLSDTSFLLTLDGEPNLDSFTTIDKAYLQAYLPGTVNSQQKIWMPNDAQAPQDPRIVPPPSTTADPLVGMSGVDLLLTESGDLATNSYGDFRLAAGMTNLIQALKIKLGTIRGTILLHPEFGLGVRVGTLNSQINVQEIYKSIYETVTQDLRFAGIQTLQIRLNGPTLTINMTVVLAGNNGVFPLTFDLAA